MAPDADQVQTKLVDFDCHKNLNQIKIHINLFKTDSNKVYLHLSSTIGYQPVNIE